MENPERSFPGDDDIDPDLDAVLILLSGFASSVGASLYEVIDRQRWVRDEENQILYSGENLRLRRQTVNNLHRRIGRALELFDFFRQLNLRVVGLGALARDSVDVRLYRREFASLLDALAALEDQIAALAQFPVPEEQEEPLLNAIAVLEDLFAVVPKAQSLEEKLTGLERALRQTEALLIQVEQALVPPIYGI